MKKEENPENNNINNNINLNINGEEIGNSMREVLNDTNPQNCFNFYSFY